MTILTLPQQSSSVRDRRTTPDLPPPLARQLLRENWGLTRRQVADAFGVTVATVRSWETGRTSPTGRRRLRYARFLAGLAEADIRRTSGERARTGTGTGTGTGLSTGRKAQSCGPVESGGPAEPAGSTRVAGAVRAVTVRRAPAVAAGTPPRTCLPTSAVRPLPVRPGSDPVSPARLRRMRQVLVAAGVWGAVLHLLNTTFPLM
ncbi:helix-turn-helix domain-containing protein [Streptomyces sp. NPDC004111]|uniref:helix-turn-helix domain-containing protein n=1 Tax=Streptomyces sp. NPDC004111 TaxID=3364690 RepID=UPI0036B52B9F